MQVVLVASTLCMFSAVARPPRYNRTTNIHAIGSVLFVGYIQGGTVVAQTRYAQNALGIVLRPCGTLYIHPACTTSPLPGLIAHLSVLPIIQPRVQVTRRVSVIFSGGFWLSIFQSWLSKFSYLGSAFTEADTIVEHYYWARQPHIIEMNQLVLDYHDVVELRQFEGYDRLIITQGNRAMG